MSLIARKLLGVGGNAAVAFDLDRIVGIQGFSVVSEETTPTGLFFSPDGLRMYVVGWAGDDVNQYSLSVPWNVLSASYVQNFSIAAQETSPSGLYFSPDGLRMYVVGTIGDDVNQYGLSTAWDVSTASYVQNFSVAAQDVTPSGIYLSPDGLNMYVLGNTGDDVNQYSLSTAWDVSTASYVRNFSIAAQDGNPLGLFFSPDGLNMYTAGFTGDEVNQYTLSTAWNISTATAVNVTSVAAQETTPRGPFIGRDGRVLYVVGSDSDTVWQYPLATAWDISTVIAPKSFSVSVEDNFPSSVSFSSDGLSMYVMGRSGDDVNQYSLSTAWDITTASYSQSFSVAAQEATPYGASFSPDGLHMYVIGTTGDDVNQYSLSTAWDISTASYVRNFSVAGQTTTPFYVVFKDDGTKMYAGVSTVFEYDLTTAWDISSATYSSRSLSFSGAGLGTSIRSIYFSPTGTTLFAASDTNDVVAQFHLSTAWDVSTGSLVKTWDVSDYEITPSGIFFRPDGKQMYLVGESGDNVLSFDLV